MAHYVQVKRIASLTRLSNSKNGNPRNRVVFTDGSSADTMADAQIGGLIENSEYQGVDLDVEFDGTVIRNAWPVNLRKVNDRI